MVSEQVGTHSYFFSLFLALGTARDGGEAGHRAFARAPLLAVQAETVEFVIGTPLRHIHLHLPVTLEIHYRAFRRVDRQLMDCLLYTSPSPRDRTRSRMPSSA